MRVPDRPILAAAAVLLGVWGGGAGAEQPVVVELFTSQGCASCPPADALMVELAEKDHVLPLALHVDYWDYIGWPDPFAEPAFTRRQKAYARAAGEKMIYTPQMIVGGSDRVIGSRGMRIAELIEAHRDGRDPVEVEVRREGGEITVEASSAAAFGEDLLIQLVTFTPHERVEIHGGENAGAVMDYVNIVREWRLLDRWDGSETWTGTVAVQGPGAIVVQRDGPGAVLGAARIE